MDERERPELRVTPPPPYTEYQWKKERLLVQMIELLPVLALTLALLPVFLLSKLIRLEAAATVVAVALGIATGVYLIPDDASTLMQTVWMLLAVAVSAALVIGGTHLHGWLARRAA